MISKSDQQLQRRRFLKNFLKNSIWLPWQPEFWMESNSANTFLRGPPKEHYCQVWFKFAQQFRRSWCLKKLLMTHNGQRTQGDPKSFPGELRTFFFSVNISKFVKNERTETKFKLWPCPLGSVVSVADS